MQPRNPAHPDEAAQLARLKRGDPRAFDQLVRENSPRLIAVARRILKDEDLALDAVQEAFFNAHRAIDRFNGEARLSSWLHRITVNAALATIRRRKRRPEVFLSDEVAHFDVGERAAADAADPFDRSLEGADELVARSQNRKMVTKCLARMKESHRRVLTLRYLEELDTAETARVLGVVPNTVKTRLLRARGALRCAVEGELSGHWAA